ncbi:S-adenosyl-L-methionine-dependent methyltransferase [Lasiosphaeris hirsuta]|uniref:S-adenosyl-L-methionine-dependent methyltransferase n=1 Tax=Lasiosphaeris hirsuta TaxID=260670 RepID=A0AA40E8Q9_9PEZI|nr:S-adenosyl-L-methionine-dependent methyltransferase [Lasiosphaeris hirsuta]
MATSEAAIRHPLPSPTESFTQRASDSSDNEGFAEEKRRAAALLTKRQRRPHSKNALNLDHLDKASQPNRFKTFRASFKYLHDLTPEQVDDFMASYVIYNLDWADEAQMVAALGPNYRDRVGECLRSYYGVLNHLCALGDVEKMYIPPLMDRRATVLENQLLFERSVANAIGLKAGDRVLDLGCGRGRVAAHMATAVPGVHVTGLNIDPNQIAQAKEFSEERGLVGNEFVVQDFNELPLPFADGTFDAFYQIQALSLCKDLSALSREIYRVLKPGARISLLDWVSLPDFDPTNVEHVELMKRVKPLIGAVGTPTPKSFESALEEAGFVVIKSENASEGGLQAPLIDRVDVYFRAVRHIILALVKLHCLPPHFKTLIDRLCLDGEAFVKMDTMRLITTSYWLVAEKPAQ